MPFEIARLNDVIIWSLHFFVKKKKNHWIKTCGKGLYSTIWKKTQSKVKENFILVILIPYKPMLPWASYDSCRKNDYFSLLKYSYYILWSKTYRGPDLGDLIAGYGPDHKKHFKCSYKNNDTGEIVYVDRHVKNVFVFIV